MSVRTQWLRDAWSFLATFVGKPGEFVVDTTNWRLVVHDGVTPGGHPTVSAGDLKTGVPTLGINTAADATNRLAVKSEAALLSWDDVTPGAGNMRLTLNKKTAAHDAGFILQTGYVSQVLFGTLGSDDLTLKTSPDGAVFRTAMTIAAATGYVGLSGVTSPSAPLHVLGLGQQPIVQLDAFGDDVAGTRAPVASCNARAARGVVGAPLPIKAADRLFGLFGAGYHAGGAYTANAVAVLGTAEEGLTAMAQGTCLDVQTTAPGTATRRAVVKIRGNGALELQPLSAEPAGGTQGQIYADSTLAAREGCRLRAYPDSVGTWTIGRGHTSAAGPPVVTAGLILTEAEADALFAADLKPYLAAVRAALAKPVPQPFFDACCSLGFNIGPANFAQSSVVRFANASDLPRAVEAFLLWDRPAAILTRRQAERDQAGLSAYGTVYARRGDPAPVRASGGAAPAAPRSARADDRRAGRPHRILVAAPAGCDPPQHAEGHLTMGFLAILPSLLGTIGPILAKVLPDEGQRLQVQLELQKTLIDQQGDLSRAMAEVMKTDAGSESRLARNARPITVLWALAIITWVGVVSPMVGL